MRLLLTLFAFLPGLLLATPLEPFQAEFRLHVSRIPTTIKANLVVEHADRPDQYRMSMESRSVMVRNREESLFQWNNCAPKSERYEHFFRGMGARRQYSMEFDWDNNTVSYASANDQGTYSITEDTLDELTMLLKAQCLFANGETVFTLTAAYGNGIRTHTFVVTGEEELDTPVGKLHTLVVEKRRRESSDRRTIFWVAPSLQYMLVKARHEESRALFGELLMRRYSGPAPLAPLADNTALDTDIEEAQDNGIQDETAE
jgi:hypothetical protein